MIVSVLIVTTTACGNGEFERESADYTVRADIINTHFDAYSYQYEQVEPAFQENYLQAALAYENEIYYVTFEADIQGTSVLVVTSQSIGEADIKRVEMQSPGNEVAAFNFTDDGNFTFFMFNRSLTQQGFYIDAYYIEYDGNGNEVTRKEFGEFKLIDNPQPNTFVVLSGGKILAIDQSKNELRELDFNTRDRGKSFTFAESTGRIRSVFPARINSPYDFLITDDSYLYGCSLENNEQTILLSWTQSGFADSFDKKVGIFNDGRVFVLSNKRNTVNDIEYDLYILTPVSRNEMPEKITVTIAGLSAGMELMQAAAIFNRQNTLYQIEIYEYLNQADIPAGDINPDTLRNVFDQARLRFQVDLMTGNVPDIIVQPTYEMINAGLLLDLNPFIDADPEINRSDFFPNALSAMEWSDGTLPLISNKFMLDTIISRSGTLGHISIWTPEELFNLVHNTQYMLLPFGANMLRDNFLDMLIREVNIGFIDFDNYQANFDNGDFINLLETAKLLPSMSDIPPEIFAYGDPMMEIVRMQAGEQLLSRAFFASPDRYQAFADTFEDIIALGIPTATGGVNIIAPYSQLGIGAATEHADAAWAFLRSFLLPSAAEFSRDFGGDVGFPIRIDLYNELIKDMKNPRTYLRDTGEVVEYPREILNVYDGSGRIELYAMSEEVANDLRSLIDSAISLKRGVSDSDELWEVIESDLADFYAGIRTAGETARIIQNRAKIWLSEQKLLAGG